MVAKDLFSSISSSDGRDKSRLEEEREKEIFKRRPGASSAGRSSWACTCRQEEGKKNIRM